MPSSAIRIPSSLPSTISLSTVYRHSTISLYGSVPSKNYTLIGTVFFPIGCCSRKSLFICKKLKDSEFFNVAGHAPSGRCRSWRQCCAQFWPLPDYYPPSIGRFRVRCGGGVRVRGGVRIRQSYSDLKERGNNLAGGRKWAQHRKAPDLHWNEWDCVALSLHVTCCVNRTLALTSFFVIWCKGDIIQSV